MVRNCKFLTFASIFRLMLYCACSFFVFSCDLTITCCNNGILIGRAADGVDRRAIWWGWWDLWCGGKCPPEAGQTFAMDQDSCEWGCSGLSCKPVLEIVSFVISLVCISSAKEFSLLFCYDNWCARYPNTHTFFIMIQFSQLTLKENFKLSSSSLNGPPISTPLLLIWISSYILAWTWPLHADFVDQLITDPSRLQSYFTY